MLVDAVDQRRSRLPNVNRSWNSADHRICDWGDASDTRSEVGVGFFFLVGGLSTTHDAGDASDGPTEPVAKFHYDSR